MSDLGRARPGRGNAVLWASLTWLAVVATLAILADVLPLQNPNTPTAQIQQPPSSDHVLGTDTLGRDLLARTVHGARVSLFVSTTSVLAALAIGGTLGLVAGYVRGRVDRVIMAAADVLLAFPSLVLVLAMVTFLGPSVGNVTAAIAVISIAPVARIIRASTMTHAHEDYVTAARVLGASHGRILRREILPNVVPTAASFALVALALAIIGESALSFLGLSAPAPQATWGGMISEGRTVLDDAPHVSLVPALVMFVTLLAMNLAGDALKQRLDLRESAL